MLLFQIGLWGSVNFSQGGVEMGSLGRMTNHILPCFGLQSLPFLPSGITTTMVQAPKPTTLDTIVSAHLSSHGFHAVGAKYKATDMHLFCNPTKLEAASKDVEELGDDRLKAMFNRGKRAAEDVIEELGTKKARLDEIRDEFGAYINNAVNQRAGDLVHAARAMDEIRAKKRAASASKSAAARMELNLKIAAIVEPLRAIDGIDAYDIEGQIAQLMMDTAKANSVYEPNEEA